MNIQEYISSGIIESCVLGLASEEEQREFEQMCSTHPDVKKAREAFELLLEEQAIADAVPPPGRLKQNIWNQISFSNAVTNSKLTKEEQARVVKPGWLRYAVAACLILLAGSMYWNISLRNENQKIKDTLAGTQQKLEDAKNSLAGMEKEADMIQGNPNLKMASLSGMPASPTSFATVYWDTTSKDVYLMVNNLPKPATGQQYQLWALLNGKPIDMGMLTITEKPLQLYKMKNVQAAQAFAITLERKGGNPTPQGPMYVMGKL